MSIIDELRSLEADKPIFFDTETVGLYGQTRLVQVRQGEYHKEIDCFRENIEEIKDALKDKWLVIHNAHYDLSCQDFKRWLPRKVDDTLLLARMQWPELDSHSLANLSVELNLAHKGDEGSSDWGQWALTEKQMAYSATDTLLVEELWELIDKSLLDNRSYKLNMISLRLALVYQHAGMPVDHKAVAQNIRQLSKELAGIGLPEDLNVNSSKQVCAFLGTKSSSVETLTDLDTPDAKKVLEKRSLIKSISYLTDAKQHKALCSYIQPYGAKTARFTSRGGDLLSNSNYVNLQQIPRKLKNTFGVKAPAVFVTADYPALEIWMGGAITGDPFLVNVLKKKEDLHWATAETMFGKPRDSLEKHDRILAKCCNFTLLYGAGSKTLQASLKMLGHSMSEAEVKSLREAWLSTYKRLSELHQETFDYFNKHTSKIVYTPLGYPMCARKPTEALNFSIQGGGAECTKLSLWLLHKQGIHPVNTVHDSIALIATSEKESIEYKSALKWAMEEAYRRIISNCEVSDLSLDVDVYVGESYY